MDKLLFCLPTYLHNTDKIEFEFLTWNTSLLSSRNKSVVRISIYWGSIPIPTATMWRPQYRWASHDHYVSTHKKLCDISITAHCTNIVYWYYVNLHTAFQNYLRTQAGNTTTVNIITCTVDYLLRLQESISDFYWHYSSQETIDLLGRDSLLKAFRVAKQVFRTLTEYIQVRDLYEWILSVHAYIPPTWFKKLYISTHPFVPHLHILSSTLLFRVLVSRTKRPWLAVGCLMLCLGFYMCLPSYNASCIVTLARWSCYVNY